MKKDKPYIFGVVVGFALVCALGAVGTYEAGGLPFPALLALYGASLAVLWGFALITYTIGKRQAKQKRTGCNTPTFRKPPPPPPIPPLPPSLYEHELLPCPFCGCKAELQDAERFGGKRRFLVLCNECGVATAGTAESKKEAAYEWNRRVDEQLPWAKENPHIIALPLGHQPTNAVDSDPPNIGSSVQKPKESNRAERFFSPEDVRKMSPAEVRENYEAIMQSMKKW